MTQKHRLFKKKCENRIWLFGVTHLWGSSQEHKFGEQKGIRLSQTNL